MAFYIEHLGLDFLFESKEIEDAFINYVVQKGTPIIGYDNMIYFNKHLGTAQIIISGKAQEQDGKKCIELQDISTHCSGIAVWKFRVIDELSENYDECDKQLLVRRTDGGGMAVVNVLNNDVLPSYEPDTVIEAQVIGFPESITYYTDEAEFENSVVAQRNGEAIIPREGMVVPVGIFVDSDSSDDTDSLQRNIVNVHGKIKKLRRGEVNLEDIVNNEDTKKVFYPMVCCVIDTEYGELEIVHTSNMLDETQLKKIKVGAVVDFYGIISADAAIDDYEKSFVKNHENNLHALSYSMCGACAERLLPILSDDFSFYSETSQKSCGSVDEFMERLKNICANGLKCSTRFATITNVKEPGENEPKLDFGIGERCFVIRYEGDDNFSSIAFIENDEFGKIKRVYLSDDPRYFFTLDEIPETYCDFVEAEEIE